MKKIFAFTLLFAMFANADFSNEQFEIKSPAFSQKNVPAGLITMFFLPAYDNFTANILVQKQHFPANLDAYKQMLIKQTKSLNHTVIHDSINGNILLFEYKGMQNNREFHWYAKASKHGDYMYLVTGTSTENGWSVQADIIRNSVNSFKLKGKGEKHEHSH